MKVLALIGSLLLVACGYVASAPAEDEVVDLPGLPSQPSFKHYAGYLEATQGRHYFYWFTESQNADPATAPIVFWFNGGPGCSSVNGMLTENGPFSVNADGATLSYNSYAWNQLANVVFVESPAGVGFSYADNQAQILTNDEQAAIDNYAAVGSFFDKFPEYFPNQLFITGESYAGIYVPTLSYLIANGSTAYNFQGFAVGNGMHDYRMNYNTKIDFDAFHGLFDLEITNNILTYCCDPTTPVTCDYFDNRNPDCVQTLLDANVAAELAGVNPYNIIGYCAKPTSGKSNYQPMAKRFHPMPKTFTKEQKAYLQSVGSDPPCYNSDNIRAWINQESVRTALHVPDIVQQWDTCSDAVGATYLSTYETMAPQYNFLLNKVRALVYNGDTDTMCNFIAGEQFVESLGRDILEPYHPWYFEGQTAGFIKVFNNITYLTVLGSGHMVPTDRPAQALYMFNNFIQNLPFGTQ